MVDIPQTITLGEIPVNIMKEQTILVTNRGNQSGRVRFEVSPPLAVHPENVFLDVGYSEQVNRVLVRSKTVSAALNRICVCINRGNPCLKCVWPIDNRFSIFTSLRWLLGASLYPVWRRKHLVCGTQSWSLMLPILQRLQLTLYFGTVIRQNSVHRVVGKEEFSKVTH